MPSVNNYVLIVILAIGLYFFKELDAERLYQPPDLSQTSTKPNNSPRDFVNTNLNTQKSPNINQSNVRGQQNLQGVNTRFIEGERGTNTNQRGPTTPWPQLGTNTNRQTQNIPRNPNNNQNTQISGSVVPNRQGTNVNQQPMGPVTQQNGGRTNTNANLNQNIGGTNMQSGTRNPSLAHGGTGTTPWPALGGRKNQNNLQNQQVSSNVPQGPPNSAWNKPLGAPNSGGGVSLSDVLKIPSYNPGWNMPSTTKGPILASTRTPIKPGFDANEEAELREFSEGLLKKDVNNAAKYITINFQGKTSSNSKDDKAPQPLLEVKQDALSIPTVSKLIQLHNNYILETSESEHSTAQEKAEENALLDAVLPTQIMQATRNFLVEKGKVSKDPKDFRDLMKLIWFNMYARGSGKISSSGFEHVFLAEIKNQDVSGLHNWVYFNDQEEKHKANYLGFLKTLDLGNKGAIVKYHFTFSNLDKPVGSMFIGTSPELEMALYTTCFVLKPNQPCPMRLNGHNFVIRTYTYKYRGKTMIGSAFPEI